MVPNWIIWPSELNQKGIPLFPRSIQYRERLKGFSFFGIVRLFPEKKFPKGSPSMFWCFATMDVKKCERVPLLARQFGFLGACDRKYFDSLNSFCYFWALDMAPTWAGAVCYLILLQMFLWCSASISSKFLEIASHDFLSNTLKSFPKSSVHVCLCLPSRSKFHFVLFVM